jgi:hypothetical protein
MQKRRESELHRAKESAPECEFANLSAHPQKSNFVRPEIAHTLYRIEKAARGEKNVKKSAISG